MFQRDGEEYVLNGRKWWTSNGMDPRWKLNSLIDLEFVNINTGARSAYLWERRTPLPPSINSRQWSWYVPSKESQTVLPFLFLTSRSILNLSGSLWFTWNQNLATSLCFRSQRSTCRPRRGVFAISPQLVFFFTKILLWPLCLYIVFDHFIHSRHK